jgi:probable HAF family extracellular repeat protein
VTILPCSKLAVVSLGFALVLQAPLAGQTAGPTLTGRAVAKPVPHYIVVQMDTLSDEFIMGTAFALDPAFDPMLPVTHPVLVGASFGDFEPFGQGVLVSANRAAGYHVDGTVSDLGVWNVSEAHGMNAAGTVVGFAGAGLVPDHAFRYANGSWTELPGVSGADTNATAVNAHDIVVGYESSGWGHSTPLYWTADNQVHILPVGGGSSEIWAINDHDVVAGMVDAIPSGTDTAFTMNVGSGGPTLLPSPLGSDVPCYAEGLNDLGQVVGETTQFGAYQPVLWDQGHAIMLPIIPDEGTGGGHAYDINNHGVIVGNSNWGKAVVWIGGMIYDLNELTPEYAPFLKNARAINDQGVIACESDAGATRAVLLVPVP